ncbi:hypothetical protein [Cereibacter sphaeroides]|uniref:hypothetical protein n=1 Tax=Cereibacter sphaeroides TaxID=1063 RepID=UPI001F3C24FD|nr:hypothetical protein [Cereibacter sphaeroides]MCE6967469.1 hypothetical protein [Cereibacter sphaeroides]
MSECDRRVVEGFRLPSAEEPLTDNERRWIEVLRETSSRREVPAPTLDVVQALRRIMSR